MILRVYIIITQLLWVKCELDSFRTRITETRILEPFKSYRDVQLFQYAVPPQVDLASFRYKAIGNNDCQSEIIEIYLQYGSYPIMNLQNSTYPEYISIKRMYVNNAVVQLDLVPAEINIQQPLSGHWYASAVLVDDSDKIKQKGLFNPCLSKLFSSLKLNIIKNAITLLQKSETTQNASSHQIYRFFANKNSWLSAIHVSNCSTSGKCPIIIKARPMGLPSVNEDEPSFINCSISDECSLLMIPANQDWNYVSIETLKHENFQFNLRIQTTDCDDSMQDVELEPSDIKTEWNGTLPSTNCWPSIPFVRISPPMNIAFEYNRLSPSNGSFVFNISNSIYTLASFQVYSSVDIGQAIVIESGLFPLTNPSLQNKTIHVCVTYGTRPNSWDMDCTSGRILSATSAMWNVPLQQLFVPFPEAGTWYIRLHTSCNNQRKFRSHFFSCEGQETEIFFRVRSTPCVSQMCGRYGTCSHDVSGGFVFSTCKCFAGWKGWGCTDNSTAKSDARLMLDVAILTLSNIFIIPAVVLSFYRKYYTESFVYCAAMIASVLYHGCNAEVFSYCVASVDLLLFCDTFLANFGIWVTLILMSEFSRTFQSCAHVVGAVSIGSLTQYDVRGLQVFVWPFGIGLAILLTSWMVRCRKTGVMCYPTLHTWLISLVPGICLALTGLALFAFFETKGNYSLVHSAWHVLIALSIVFLLPRHQAAIERTEETASSAVLVSS